MNKLQWKLKKNGDEVAGPFSIEREASDFDFYPWNLAVCGYVYECFKTCAQAKSYAQRIADKVVRNMRGAK